MEPVSVGSVAVAEVWRVEKVCRVSGTGDGVDVAQANKNQSGGGDRSRRGGTGGGRGRPGSGSKAGGQRGRSDDGSSARDRDHRRGANDDQRRRSGGREGARGTGGQGGKPRQRRAFSVDGGPSNLPRWLKEEIQRVTPNDRREATLTLLSEAAGHFADHQFGAAHRKLLRAKQLSSRAAAIRELLGLTAYRMDKWDEALRELRTFRRLAGDTTHMPIEMDTLRALGRPTDVHKVWELYKELGGSPGTEAEARVVYGSFLIDEGQVHSAWNIVKPKRLSRDADEFERRRWYVAARAAALLGDIETATKIADALDEAEVTMVGLQELRDEIAALAARTEEA